MPNIVLLSAQPVQWRKFLQTLEKDLDVQTAIVTEGVDLRNRARKNHVLAAVLDSHIAVPAGVALVRDLMTINAMIHVAWACDLEKDEFHEVTEGLGILMQLPQQPDIDDAHRLAHLLRQLSGTI